MVYEHLLTSFVRNYCLLKKKIEYNLYAVQNSKLGTISRGDKILSLTISLESSRPLKKCGRGAYLWAEMRLLI